MLPPFLCTFQGRLPFEPRTRDNVVPHLGFLPLCRLFLRITLCFFLYSSTAPLSNRHSLFIKYPSISPRNAMRRIVFSSKPRYWPTCRAVCKLSLGACPRLLSSGSSIPIGRSTVTGIQPP